jgi:2-polyprenyl-6-methoxyphenol hydroxylase-like FAD-dependent oxidoreductase
VLPDVVIVGAGIGGAALALALGRSGRRVALVEREATPPRRVRPEILWGATLDALAKLRVADRIRRPRRRGILFETAHRVVSMPLRWNESDLPGPRA